MTADGILTKCALAGVSIIVGLIAIDDH